MKDAVQTSLGYPVDLPHEAGAPYGTRGDKRNVREGTASAERVALACAGAIGTDESGRTSRVSGTHWRLSTFLSSLFNGRAAKSPGAINPASTVSGCKIAFFHQNEVENAQGGVERYVATLLSSGPQHPFLITEQAPSASPNRIRVELFGPKSWPKTLRYSLAILFNARRLRRELALRKLEVFEFSRPAYALFAWLFPGRKVFTFHGMGPDRRDRVRRLIHDLTCVPLPVMADSIQIVGRDDSALPRWVLSRLRSRVVHIDAWYDERFRPTPLPPLNGGPIIVFYSGRLAEDKNPALLFEIIRKARAELPFPVEFRYFGADTVELERAGLADAVTSSGLLDPKALAAAIAQCHLGILCSKAEGSPFAMVETIACGRGFVASPIRSLVEPYHDKVGVFFAERLDADAFLDAISRARAFLLAGASADVIAAGVKDRSQSNAARAVLTHLHRLADDTGPSG